jgi:hypothetical protein
LDHPLSLTTGDIHSAHQTISVPLVINSPTLGFLGYKPNHRQVLYSGLELCSKGQPSLTRCSNLGVKRAGSAVKFESPSKQIWIPEEHRSSKGAKEFQFTISMKAHLE